MNEMRKLMEAVQHLDEYGTSPPGNYFELDPNSLAIDSDGMIDFDAEDIFILDHSDNPEEVLINVANQLLQHSLRVEVVNLGDDQYYFRIVK